MPQIPLIGIAGRARSGKDTVANFIIAAIGGYRYSFADPIRAMLVPLGVDMSDPYWQAHKEDPIPALGVSPRRMMQTLGTEWGRQLIHPDLWLFMAHQRLLQNGPGMVIPDVRFENEAAWVRKHGGRIIHVIRPNAKAVEAHASEEGIEIQDTDARLFNSGTLEELQISVRELLHVFD
jgi:hypothetical protein